MASVTSLDSDMRNLRLSKYTASAANQAKQWVEETLGERLPSGDLLEGLKDGVALCKLANLVLPPPGIKFKTSAMPFVQMENISHFLRACEMAPLNMPAHDRFLTVDLYELKDPAQVLQCLGAFSRVASHINPSRVPTSIDGRRSGALSPAGTGSAIRNGGPGAIRGSASLSSMKPATTPAARPISPTKTGGSTTSSHADSLRSPGPTSSWSKKGDEGNTAPAWNIHQYGYMGGASQGNQGISFGGRRQITSAGPSVPNLAEKQRIRREKEQEEARRRQEEEEQERRRKRELEEEEERARIEEEKRWEQETKRQREEERRRLEEQKRQWEEQERKWKIEEEARLREEAEEKKARPNGLNGQFLSQYQAEQANSAQPEDEDTPERQRVRELEKQLEEARERERQYQLEREQRMKQERSVPARRVDSAERPSSAKGSEASWAPDERETLRQAAPQRSGLGSARPLPLPATAKAPSPSPSPAATPEPSTRPLPDPTDYQPKPQTQNRTDQFIAQNKPPVFQRPASHRPAEMATSSTLEEQDDRDRRIASQQKTKEGGWASKSLLEREMERERERQKEWEANQEASKTAVKDMGEGSRPGQSWNVNQYGFTGGDSQNKGSSSGSGIAFGGRRQIIGPRPQPGQR